MQSDVIQPTEPQSEGWKLPYLAIWSGQALSLLGSDLVSFALTWWLTEQTGSATVLTTSFLVLMLPDIVLGPLIGTVVDRWRRRWIMVCADGAIALCTAVLALLYWQGAVAVWHVYVFLFLRALGGAFHAPAMTASTSLMVPKQHLVRVNGWNSTRSGASRVVGAPLGALLLSVMPISGVLAIDVVTALIAIVPLLFIDVPQPTLRAASRVQDGLRPSAWRRAVSGTVADTTAGFRYLWNWRGLFIMLTSMSLMGFLILPTNNFSPLIIRDHFGGGPDAYALHGAVVGAGTICGGLLMSTWGGFRRRFKTMVLGMGVYAVCNIARGLAPANALWLWLGASFVRYLFNQMVWVPFNATLQATVPAHVQGRVFAARNSLFGLMSPLGLVILGPLGDRIGPRPLIVLTGVAVFLMLGFFAMTPSVRNLEDGPPAPVILIGTPGISGR